MPGCAEFVASFVVLVPIVGDSGDVAWVQCSPQPADRIVSGCGGMRAALTLVGHQVARVMDGGGSRVFRILAARKGVHTVSGAAQWSLDTAAGIWQPDPACVWTACDWGTHDVGERLAPCGR